MGNSLRDLKLSSSGILTTLVTMTAADVNALDTTGKVILPVPPSGAYYALEDAEFFYHYDTTNFSSGGPANMSLQISNLHQINGFNITDLGMTGNVDYTAVVKVNNLTSPVSPGDSLRLFAFDNIAGGGSSTLQLRLRYRIVTILTP